jgi:hypothetical protein
MTYACDNGTECRRSFRITLDSELSFWGDVFCFLRFDAAAADFM